MHRGKSECRKEGSSVDVSFTTHELAAMFKRSCVSRFTALKVWRELPNEAFDVFPGAVSGGSVYTGGRRVTESEVELDGRRVKAAVASALQPRWSFSGGDIGKTSYEFIEVMACPGDV